MAWNDEQTLSESIDPAEWNSMVEAINTQIMTAYYQGTPTTTSENILTFRFPVDIRITRIYITALTAPGAGYTTTLTITDGVTPLNIILSDTSKTGYLEDLTQEYDADTFLEINVVASDNSAATEGITIMYFCEVV